MENIDVTQLLCNTITSLREQIKVMEKEHDATKAQLRQFKNKDIIKTTMIKQFIENDRNNRIVDKVRI